MPYFGFGVCVEKPWLGLGVCGEKPYFDAVGDAVVVVVLAAAMPRPMFTPDGTCRNIHEHLNINTCFIAEYTHVY